MARRSDLPFSAWQLPQGGLKKGEDPARAVLREVAEETGTCKVVIVAETAEWLRYDLPQALADRAWNGRWRGQEQKWFALRFTGSDGDIDLATSAHQEFDAWRWEHLDALPALAVPFKRHVYLHLVKAFAGVVAAQTANGRA